MNGRKSTEGEHDVHVNVPCSSYDYNHADHADDETRRVKREQSFSKQGLGKLSSVGRPKFSLAYARQLLDTNYYAGVALCAAGDADGGAIIGGGSGGCVGRDSVGWRHCQ